MTSLVFESALRATLIVASVAVVLKALRVESPAIRHALWTGVLILMLMLPALVAWGPKAPLPILPTEAAGRTTSAFSTGTTNPIVAATPLALWAWQTLVPGAYVLGLITLLFRLVLSMSEVRSLRREARPDAGKLTHARCASPVVVGYLRPTVILPRGWSAWTQEQLDAVLLHEGEHIRRRDPLVQWVALLNRAVFWFHPLAWWLERHVSALAEDACDDAVLARGHDAQEYCEQLITLARAASQAGARVQAPAMAMAGAQLPRRIHRILRRINAPQVSRMRLACAAAACVAIGVVCGSGTLTQAEGRLKPLGAAVALPNQPPVTPPASIADRAASQVAVPGQDKGLTLPRAVFEVKPEYTALAKEMRIQGSVWMKVVVLASGDVGDVEVTRSLDTQYGLDDQAVEAVRQWKFEPGRKDEKVVPVQVTIEMRFALR